MVRIINNNNKIHNINNGFKDQQQSLIEKKKRKKTQKTISHLFVFHNGMLFVRVLHTYVKKQRPFKKKSTVTHTEL